MHSHVTIGGVVHSHVTIGGVVHSHVTIGEWGMTPTF